jgi:general secretion pathway protein D
MVFIRPHILHSENESVQVTGSKYNSLRQEQLNIARSQETYTPDSNKTISPPLNSADLPKPFANHKNISRT